MVSGITGDLEFDDLRQLLAGESDLLDKLDVFSGAALVVGSAVTGGAGLLALLGPKNELVKVGKRLVSKLTANPPDDYLERHRRMAAAHYLIVYTAFFAAAAEPLSAVKSTIRLRDDEKKALLEEAVPIEGIDGVRSTGIADALRLPHPVQDFSEKKQRLSTFYATLSTGLGDCLDCIDRWQKASAERHETVNALLVNLPGRAVELYEAQYFELATQFPQFFMWANLHSDGQMHSRLDELDTDVRHLIRLSEDSEQQLDLGMAALGEAVRALPTDALQQKAVRIAKDLETTYSRALDEPVIDDQFEDSGAAKLVYPKRSHIFIPQAFRVRQAPASGAHRMQLEDPEKWEEQTLHQDLGGFVLRYLSSPYSAETPLIVLGHPGSGKSLLTSMLAARLATPAYNPIRIALRDVEAERELPGLLADQVEYDTSRRMDWGELSDNLAAPPVVLLDGFDELLQASGRIYADYLTRVREFQQHERDLGRPVRVIVTSRITLIDKAHVPNGSTVLRLEDFDEHRRQKWVNVWNRHNRAYFKEMRVQELVLPEDKAVTDLARQPLLLLMLAVFDSDRNQLHKQKNLDRTLLYDQLLRRFIVRERQKGKARAEFAALSKNERDGVVDSDMRRLGVAAMSMFNRRTLHILRDELDRDIEYFELERPMRDGAGRNLSQGELLLGSFFFVHESRAKGGETAASDGVDEESRGESAFEFLHNTFGEFLTANFVLSSVLKEARSLATMRDSSDLSSDYDRKLRPGGLPASWYASLKYTGLFTRPVILEMVREWCPHLLKRMGLKAEKFVASLDTLVHSELKHILAGSSPPALLKAEGTPPYEDLPLLGHYAIYSLNLVLLRAVSEGRPVSFDEADLNQGREGGPRAWDQLTHLWRSWIPIDSLAGLDAIIESRRDDGVVEVRPRRSFGVPHTANRLETVWSAARALADSTMSGMAGLHRHDASLASDESLLRASRSLEAENIDLELEVLLRRHQSVGWGRDAELDEDLGRHASQAIQLQRVSRSHTQLLRLLGEPDAPAGPRRLAVHDLTRPAARMLTSLPPEFVIAYIRLCGSLQPLWVVDLLEETLDFPPLEPILERSPTVAAAILDLVEDEMPAEVLRRRHMLFRREITPMGRRYANRRSVAVDTEALIAHLSDRRDLHAEIRVALLQLAIRIDAKGLSDRVLRSVHALSHHALADDLSPDRLRYIVSLSDGGDMPLRKRLATLGRNADALDRLPRDVALDCMRIAGRAPKSELSALRRAGWPGTAPLEEISARVRFVVTQTRRERRRAGMSDDGRRHTGDIPPSRLATMGIAPDQVDQLPAGVWRDLMELDADDFL